jgi:steroid 5-alpha reductase family enzyme
MWVVSLPVRLAQYGDDTWVDVPFGGRVVAGGSGFEAVGDAQPARFGADSSNRRNVLDSALWRRRPNYFVTHASGGDFLYSRAMSGSDL